MSNQASRLDRLERISDASNRPPMTCTAKWWRGEGRFEWEGKTFDSREALDAALELNGFGRNVADLLVLIKVYSGSN